MGRLDTEVSAARALALVAVVILVAVGTNIGREFQLPARWRAVAVHPSDTLADAIANHPTTAVRYGLYAELRGIASGATILLPAEHPLDVNALQAISLLQVAVESTRIGSERPLPHSPVEASGQFENSIAQRDAIWTYEIRVPPRVEPDTLRLWVGESTLIIAPVDRQS